MSAWAATLSSRCAVPRTISTFLRAARARVARPFGHHLGGQGSPARSCSPSSSGQDLGPRRIQGAAAQPRIQIIAGFRQSRNRKAGRGVDHPVLHLAVLADHDHQRLARRRPRRIPHASAARSCLAVTTRPGAARQAGQRLGRLGQDILDIAGRCPTCGPRWRRARRGARSPISSKPSTNRRRPFSVGTRPGAGVGGIKQAHGLQVRHHIADRGRRQGERQALGQGARAHRLAAGQESLHQMAENLLGPVGQALRHHKGGSERIQAQAFENLEYSALPGCVCAGR